MLFLFFKSGDFTGTYVLLSESVDKSLAKYARGVIVLLYRFPISKDMRCL